jgi:deazaflavin-dependent oxidoreductase (nitroreductase family)
MTIETPPGGTHGNRAMGGPMVRFGARMMAAVYRRSNRMAKNMLLLETVGAKSGDARVAPLGFIADGVDGWVITASAGGSARNPAWLHNLALHPDKVSIVIGKDRVKVRPEVLAGEDRAAAWARIVAASPQYGKYPTQTDREIAVIRLTREA